MVNLITETKCPIFIIGLQRTGTTSFHVWLEKQGVDSYHVASFDDNLLEACRKGKSLPHRSYSDMVFMHMDVWFEKSKEFVRIAKENVPDAKFVLNVRDPQTWVRAHFQLFASMNIFRTKEQLQLYMQRWYEYHAYVLNLFKDEPERLLVFDIKRDTVEKINAFFGVPDEIGRRHWAKTNATRLDIVKDIIPDSSWWHF